MSRSRGSLAASALLTATAAATAWIAMSSWRGFSQQPGGYLNPLMLLAIVVGGTGLATRWWRFPAPLVLLVQVVVSGVVTSLIITGSPIPVGSAWTELHTTLSQAVHTANGFAAPVPASAPPIDSVLILSGLGCLLLVDLLACTLRRVPLAGLPLLTIYTIPVSMADDGIAWWVFVLTALGFLTMLYLQESDQVTRWGRPLGEDRETGDPIAFGAGAHTVRATAGTVGGVATALAIFLPALIPSLGIHVFDFGPGSGNGSDIRVDNPTADLVRDLKQGDDTPLIKVTTTDRDPSYLRILTLTRYTDAEWTPGNRDVPADHLADGQLPAPVGVGATVTRREVPYDVTILPAFDSTWLPTQPPLGRIDAVGDWRYDDQTLDFLAGDDDLSTSGLHYTMGSLDLDLTAERLEAAGTSTGKVSEIFTDVPSDLPTLVRDLAVEVTSDEATRFDKAVALQNWFREDGGFTYSLETAEGSGNDALVNFLSDDAGGRTGYCEQFASAMAVMARVIGIPARVAIGFLTPTPAGANTWIYSARDMHAWPELYFDGAGWVRFEPTPAGRAENVPAYTIPAVPGTGEDPSESESATPGASSSGPTDRPTRELEPTSTGGKNGDAASGFPWVPVVGSLAGVVLVLSGLMLPRLVRRRRRERRLGGGPEAIWAELRDTAVDLAVPWPAARSPRGTRDVLVDHLGAPVDEWTTERPPHGADVAPEGVAALDRLVLDLELLRYSRAGSTADRPTLRSDGEACVAALVGGAPRSARRRAEWWPRSVLILPVRSAGPAPHTVDARFGAVVDRVN
jgi:transglutaminase-like putative cysteine protease